MKHENKPNGETDGNTLKKQQFCNARSKKSYTCIPYTETQISTQGGNGPDNGWCAGRTEFSRIYTNQRKVL